MKFQTSQRSKPTVDSIRTIDGTDYRVTAVIGKYCHECGGAAPNGRSCRRCGSTGRMLGKWIYEGEPVEQSEADEEIAEEGSDEDKKEESGGVELLRLEAEFRTDGRTHNGKTAAQAHGRLDDRRFERARIVTRVDGELTYSEWTDDAEELANRLTELGWERPDFVSAETAGNGRPSRDGLAALMRQAPLLIQMGYTMKIIDGLSSHEIDADDIQKFGVGRTNTGADNFHLEGDDAMSRTFDSAEAAVAHAEDSGLHNIFSLIDDGRAEGACWFPVIIK